MYIWTITIVHQEKHHSKSSCFPGRTASMTHQGILHSISPITPPHGISLFSPGAPASLFTRYHLHFHQASVGTPSPHRVRIRAPCVCPLVTPSTCLPGKIQIIVLFQARNSQTLLVWIKVQTRPISEALQSRLLSPVERGKRFPWVYMGKCYWCSREHSVLCSQRKFNTR